MRQLLYFLFVYASLSCLWVPRKSHLRLETTHHAQVYPSFLHFCSTPSNLPDISANSRSFDSFRLPALRSDSCASKTRGRNRYGRDYPPLSNPPPTPQPAYKNEPKRMIPHTHTSTSTFSNFRNRFIPTPDPHATGGTLIYIFRSFPMPPPNFTDPCSPTICSPVQYSTPLTHPFRHTELQILYKWL